MAIIVTGAAGFIGSAYITYLNKVEPDKKIIAIDKDNLDNLSAKNLNNLKLTNYMSDSEFINKVVHGSCYTPSIESIIHFGATSTTTETNFKLILENNFRYSKCLANFCKNQKIPFIYASSAATYGNGKRFDDSMTPDECSPISIYSFFKNLFDKWIIENEVPSLCLKYFNVFGPNEYHKESMISFILRTFNELYNWKTENPIIIYNDENHKYGRDFIYIKDAVKMTYFLIKNNKRGIYNIGTGITTNWIDVYKIICKVLDINHSYKIDENPFNDSYQYFTQANISKLINEGYSEKIYTLEEAIYDYYKNYLITHTLYLETVNNF